MIAATQIPSRSGFAIPSARQIVFLMLGGCAGMGFWEGFSMVPTAWVAGIALQPPELIRSLFAHRLGLDVPLTSAIGLHFLTGVLFYPLGYFLLTRGVKRFGLPADGWIWGVVTYVIALGIFAPLAGQRFLLLDVPLLSVMSLIGHAIYGYVTAYVFEHFDAR